MLEDLFMNNKLEYAHIVTYDNKNIVKSMTISTNIGKLRYLYVQINNIVYVALDITQEYPKNL